MRMDKFGNQDILSFIIRIKKSRLVAGFLFMG